MLWMYNLSLLFCSLSTLLQCALQLFIHPSKITANSICVSNDLDVPKQVCIGLVPSLKRLLLFCYFGSFLSPVSQEQTVIKAWYESASASCC
jgi:hypothetical protein